MGFDPNATPNTKIVPYVDVLPLFLPNSRMAWKIYPRMFNFTWRAKQGNCTYLVEIENLVSLPTLAYES